MIAVKIKKRQNTNTKEKLVPHDFRYVCVFCERIFGSFHEIDIHFTQFHQMGSIFTDSLNEK